MTVVAAAVADVVDDFVSHLRIFRKALKNCQENGNNLISSDV